MERYSLCVRKKGANQYNIGTIKHELAFLDYFTTRFNNQEELLKFLNLDPNYFDDIGICYRSHGVVRYLPIYYDARELEDLVTEMIDFKAIGELDDITKIAIAYGDKFSFEVKRVVPKNYITEDILRRMFYEARPYDAFEEGLLTDKILDYYQTGQRSKYENEMLGRYLMIRKAYGFLRNLDSIKPNRVSKQEAKTTMREIQDAMIAERFNPDTELTDYQRDLLDRVNKGDAAAYEELMGSSVEEVERLSPFVKGDPRRGV